MHASEASHFMWIYGKWFISIKFVENILTCNVCTEIAFKVPVAFVKISGSDFDSLQYKVPKSSISCDVWIMGKIIVTSTGIFWK